MQKLIHLQYWTRKCRAPVDIFVKLKHEWRSLNEYAGGN